jgi:predicted transcriptional regulator
MPVLTLRLPEVLEQKLAAAAELARRPRSELARDAIADYLARQEQERFLAEIARAARECNREELIANAEEALPFDNEAIAAVERRLKPSPRRTRRRTPSR